MPEPTFESLIYEEPEPHIARIRLNRPDRANAQDTGLLYEAMGRRIAAKSRFALKLTKLALNGVADAQGRETAMRNAFHLHQLAHTHNPKVFDLLMDPTGLPEATRKALAARTADGG